MTTQPAVKTADYRTTGYIQPFGALIAVDQASEIVVHVSGNIGDILGNGWNFDDTTGQTVGNVLGSKLTHALRNACALPSIRKRPESLGFETFSDRFYEVSATQSGDDLLIVEIGPEADSDPTAASILKDVAQLNDRIQTSSDPVTLLTDCANLMRTISGYDRVLVYRFDGQGMAEVVGESRRLSLGSHMGSRTSEASILSDGLAVPRLIGDADQPPVPVRSDDDMALDLSRAKMTAASDDQLRRLRTMDAAASMTLPLSYDGHAWGALSFLHRRPRLPTIRVRQVCQAFLPCLNAVLALRLTQEKLDNRPH